MRPRPFDYARAGSVAEAVSLAADGSDTHFYAGGTELLLAMKLRVVSPERLVDLKRIPGLDRIECADDTTLSIGGRATHQQIERDETVRRLIPSLSALCSNVANVRVRATGTIGGNLCFGEPHADPPTFLAALGATLVLVGAAGEREVAMDDFGLGEFETVREPDEVLTRILVPLPRGPVAYLRFRHGERPAVNCGLALAMAPDGVTIVRARVRVGALGPRLQALDLVEERLAGVRIADARAAAAAGLPEALERLDVTDDRHGGADYKRHLAGVLLGRTIDDAARQAREALP